MRSSCDIQWIGGKLSCLSMRSGWQGRSNSCCCATTAAPRDWLPGRIMLFGDKRAKGTLSRFTGNARSFRGCDSETWESLHDWTPQAAAGLDCLGRFRKKSGAGHIYSQVFCLSYVSTCPRQHSRVQEFQSWARALAHASEDCEALDMPYLSGSAICSRASPRK